MIQSVLILTAMRSEARAIERAIAGCEAAIEVRAIGIRATRLRVELTNSEVAAVIVAGLAGALHSDLQVGDVVVDDRDGLLPQVPSWRRGRIFSSDGIVCTPEDKAELCKRTGALGVDMELQIVRDAFASCGIPVIGIRAISDRADDSIDPDVLRLVDDLGRPRIGVILWNLLRRPKVIGQSLRLARNSKFACERLGEAVRELLIHPEFIRRFGSSADCREGCERRA